MTPDVKVAAIVVTCNRLELLQECITALRNQTRLPDEIIVINNGSTDATLDWLTAQTDLIVITQPNSGSSGGQFTGIKTAFDRGHDWFWCMDDDTIPFSDALEQLLRSKPMSDTRTTYVTSLVVWTDGTIHKMNIPYPTEDYGSWFGQVLSDKAIPIKFASFVSLLVRRDAVAKSGLPIKEFFLWGDDVEFTQRIGRGMRGWLVLESKVLHKTPMNLGSPRDGDPIPPEMLHKFCYGLRNRTFVMRRDTQSVLLRTRFFVASFRRYCMRFLRGEVPAKVLWWHLKGIAFNPKVEFPADSDKPSIGL